tara:strand:- start:895 stop:1812 length:918 start_codon:yes stop_codon:yes gene_type:complete
MLLSFAFYNKLKLSKKKESEIYNVILTKLSTVKITNKNIKKTHLEFNSKMRNIIMQRNLKSFLKISFLQKMFFVHNRFFILLELLHLRKGKWNFYKHLLKESSVGDPVRYFLYPNSSGNTINHVFHLSILKDEFNIKLKSIKSVFEFGGGYGCMAKIFYLLNKNIRYTIFDTPIVNLLQYYYLKSLNLDVGYKNHRFKLQNELSKNTNLQNNKVGALFIANWSLSEVPIKFRNKFLPIINQHQFFLISFQHFFEEVNNFTYFKDISAKLNKRFEIKFIKNKFYKGSIFKKEDHYFMIGRKWQTND